ncbi:MAG: redoxin domain-containing protein [Cyanobacteria bacterium SZAS-4]|nr:redoxin domain-containing protein [Cyanobacteria bacterium SZAS-4]
MKRSALLLFFCLITLINSAPAETAQTNGGSTDSVEPVHTSERLPETVASPADGIAKAEQLLKMSCDFYRSLNSISGQLTSDTTTKKDSEVTHKMHLIGFEFERSKYLSVKVLKPVHGGVAVLNGSNASFYNPKWKTYAKATINSFDQIFQNQDFSFVTDGVLSDTLFQALLSDDPYAGILKNRKIKSYDGITKIGGESCHQITFSTSDMTCDSYIWLSAGDKPWVRKYTPVRDCPINFLPVRPGPVTQLSINASYDRMRDNYAVRKRALKPSASSKSATHLAGSAGDDARQIMVGQRAPKVNISTTDGGKFSLSRVRGKVVVMDFWATWCGPCVRAMPVLESITGGFPKSDIAFIAVNEKEEPEKVQAFLREKSLNPLVGFDKDGEVSQRYRVVGIPQTVIIGRDGKVKSVHVGVGPNFKDQLTKELQSLVSEKK